MSPRGNRHPASPHPVSSPGPELTVDLVVFVLPVLDGRHVQRGSIWEDEAIGCQPLVSGIEHSVEHRLVEEAVAHPLADDDVHLLHWELHLLHLPLDDGHHMV